MSAIVVPAAGEHPLAAVGAALERHPEGVRCGGCPRALAITAELVCTERWVAFVLVEQP